MGIEENKEKVKKYIEEVLNNGDYTNVDEYPHKDFAGRPTARKLEDKADHKESFSEARKQIPDMHNNIQELVAEGDTVVAITSWTMTDTNGWFGNKPTNKPFETKTIVVYSFKDGKIIKGIALSDRLGVCKQLGITPDMDTVPMPSN